MGVLDGKVALVTGAGQGVGQGIALALAEEGAAVAITGRTAETLQATVDQIVAEGGRATAIVGDIRKPESATAAVDGTVAAYGTVDILVNNAQLAPLGKILEVSDAAAEAGWASGPLACLRLMRACHPHLVGGGSIINLGSGSALRTDPTGLGVYASVKEAIRVMSRAAAVEFGPDRIRVNCLVPLAMSPGMQWWSEHFPDEYQAVVDEVPLGYVGDCRLDIGRAAVFLAGPDSRYVTGTTLVVDGGQSYLR